MSAPLLLFDPSKPPVDAWPDGQEKVRQWLVGFATSKPAILIPNLSCEMMALRHGEHLFPLTISQGRLGAAYVAAPHSAYVGYAKDELHEADLGVVEPVARVGLSIVGGLLRAAKINHIAILDNFLLATNLHGHWSGESISAIREAIVARYPSHLLAFRSVDPWSNPELHQALLDDEWVLIPSRQIWVIDDVAEHWAKRSHVKADRRKFRKSGLVTDSIAKMTDDDAVRIAELYHALYIEKYSALNPQFTATFVRLLSDSGLVSFQVARDDDGVIQGVAGCMARGGILTVPILGYAMDAPQDAGYYRIASLLFGDYAIANGLRLNCSAGAGSFKQARGARSQVEYMAFHCKHLTAARRSAIHALAWGMKSFAMPQIIKKGL